MKKLSNIIFVFSVSIIILFTLSLYPVAEAATEYKGLDVSVFQGDIDFEKVKAQGYEVVYIRAGIGDSEDANFKANTQGAKNAKMHYGFYFYVTATNTSEAEAQAKYFASLIAGTGYDCRPAVDFEEFSGLTNTLVNQIALTFAQTLQSQTGIVPLFYTDAANAESFWADSLTVYPLWVADYISTAPTIGKWKSWAGFQYTDKGTVDGISDNVDLDTFTKDVFFSTDGTESSSASSVASSSAPASSAVASSSIASSSVASSSVSSQSSASSDISSASSQIISESSSNGCSSSSPNLPQFSFAKVVLIIVLILISVFLFIFLYLTVENKNRK